MATWWSYGEEQSCGVKWHLKNGHMVRWWWGAVMWGEVMSMLVGERLKKLAPDAGSLHVFPFTRDIYSVCEWHQGRRDLRMMVSSKGNRFLSTTCRCGWHMQQTWLAGFVPQHNRSGVTAKLHFTEQQLDRWPIVIACLGGRNSIILLPLFVKELWEEGILHVVVE